MGDGWFEEWQIGDVRVVRVVENEVPIPPHLLFGDAAVPDHEPHPWLVPHHVTSGGRLVFSIHAFVVDDGQRRILVDTCVGNGKERTNPFFDGLDGPFLDRLATLGYPPDAIDQVLCTHLHLDHVGWNTRRDGDRWVPTFPNARYLLAETEWRHAGATAGDAAGPDGAGDPGGAGGGSDDFVGDSVAPLFAAGLVDLVATDHRVSPAVDLVPTIGHTPGHVAVRIRSAGAEAVITGDLIHHPVQLLDPDLSPVVEWDVERARATRHAFVRSHTDSAVLVLGTHFATPAGGRIVTGPTGLQFVAPAAQPT